MTIYGWDMSHFDAPSIGNAVESGIVFITHKAGGDALDGEIDDWWAYVKNLPEDKVLLGAYWVLYPGNPRGRADAFLARLDGTCKGWRDRPFILQVDAEQWNGETSVAAPGRADIRAFCDRLREVMPRLRPIVYAPQWVYQDRLANLGYPLWQSWYVFGVNGFRQLYPGDNDRRWGAYSGQVPAILQYTSSATIGGQTLSDANAFRGTFMQLLALVAPGWITDMELTPANLDQIGDVFDARLTAKMDDIANAVYRHPVANARKNADGSVQTTAWGELDRYDDVRADRSDVLQRANTAALMASVAALGQTEAFDVGALAAALAPAVSSAVLAGLPGGGSDITPDELKQAFESSLRELLAPPATSPAPGE